ncbi:iron-containing redox enzyme family protein [Vreelandella neptunia]|uniref:Iron-containing redox enzyme family protein n=1 Tax=Vreelandella neptunia TaxID=115551 RepID=A0ABS9S7R1_9GAMM|nr:iron-containing redox enzyme family protein [Halomonas neptunia]MCH4812151.1 iron-containing redox enzyme family protein [Halomonas neptunia]
MNSKLNIKENRITEDFSCQNTDLCRDAILSYCSSYLFADNEFRYEKDFYGRRIRPHIAKFLDFSVPANLDEIKTYKVFAANRILFAMNEVDFLMLPTTKFNPEDFKERYSGEKSAQAYLAMPFLEKYLFDFLDKEILISQNWSEVSVYKYFMSFIQEASEIKDLPSAEAIRNSKNPEAAAKDWLVQLAPDFLIESSPMARYTSGNYGELASSLFKVIIDELGYGEHEKKHSSLYQQTMISANLDPEPHKYWQYYLNGSLLLANYYNCITRNKCNFFKYLGAIFLAETSFIKSCEVWKKVLKQAIPNLDVKYFNEHCHIDVDHSRMVLESLVLPAIRKYGDFAACEIVKGFEQAKFIGNIAEEDFVKQIQWKDKSDNNKELHNQIFTKVKSQFEKGNIDMAFLDEPINELSITHSHDGDELCHIVSGEMEFLNGFKQSTILKEGDGIVIERNRLHGALINSENCEYEIYSIGDIKKWT